jgi:uncharacterized protein YecT (DUF1311 family)
MDDGTIHSRMPVRRGILFSVAALALMASGPALAPAAEQGECDYPDAQQQNNYCNAQAFWKLDGELTKAYEEALAFTKKSDQDALPLQGPDLKTETEALTIAEKAWLQYRDSHCDGLGYKARGGSLESLLVGNCKIELTKNRMKELKDIMTSLED